MEKVPVEKDKKINIGMVYSCGDWFSPESEDYFCVIIGIYGRKLYYFRKKKELNLRKYELVSFIEDENNLNEAKHVIKLEKYEIVSSENNCFRIPNGRCCDPEEWGALQRGVPFIGLSRAVNCISFPATKDGLLYYKMVLSGANDYAIRLFRESKKYENTTELTNEELKSEIVRLNDYIDKLDSTSIIKTFVVRESGRLQRRVGRDDYYWQITTRSVEGDDLYINHLLRTGEEKGYEVTNSYEENYDYIDEKATKEGIQTALSTYDKNGHLAFLLNNYIKLRYEQILKKSEIELKLNGLFGVDKVDFNIGYLAEYSYKSVVAKYNELGNECK